MPDASGPSLTKGEKIFVGGFALGAFLISLGFVIATVGWGFGFPAVWVAIALGICIASIVYAFLGGIAGTEFSAMAGIKLAGSLAAIVAIYWIFSGPLERNMNDVKAVAVGKAAEAALTEERGRTAAERAARVNAEQKLQLLEADTGIKQSDTDAAAVARVRNSSDQDDLGRAVLRIERNHEGPWRARVMKLNGRFIQDVPPGTFRFCHDKRPELQDGPVQFEAVDPDSGTSRKITLGPGGDIGPGACQVISFDVQLGCDAAKQLLAVECDARRGVAWPASTDKRAYGIGVKKPLRR